MFKKFLSGLLITSILGGATLVSGAATDTSDVKSVETIKAEIRKLGTGPDAKIKLKLLDKTKVEGYVSEANENDFTVVNPKKGTTTTVAYPQVGQAKGNNLSGGVKIALIIGAVAVLTYLSFKYGRRNRRYGF
ncbi:MAG: hypothetical protein IPM50_02510 [Acidobacteriota bacterium]|nr:MAG: hypothetical protein IPM50_02510 [Acidobacteriota bacterium]